MRNRFRDLPDYVERTGVKKKRIASDLGVSPQAFSYLLRPDVYRPRVTEERLAAIAKLLNQPVTYVRRIYRRAA